MPSCSGEFTPSYGLHRLLTNVYKTNQNSVSMPILCDMIGELYLNYYLDSPFEIAISPAVL